MICYLVKVIMKVDY